MHFGRSYRSSRRSNRHTLRKGHQPYDRDQAAREFIARLEEEYMTPDQYHDLDVDYMSGRLDFRDIWKLG